MTLKVSSATETV